MFQDVFHCHFYAQSPNTTSRYEIEIGLSNIDRGSFMKQEDFNYLERKKNGMQVILKFPRNSEHEEEIKREAKEILSGILQEHFMKNSVTIQKLYKRGGET